VVVVAVQIEQRGVRIETVLDEFLLDAHFELLCHLRVVGNVAAALTDVP
jgi:hypothetical protein